MFNERERSLLPAQFALRVAILSGIALVMFSIIFFRLWYLQVLSSDDYLKQAQNNQVREVNVQAPRGEILDRKGQVLVDNRTALALQVLPPELPQKRHKQREEFARLSHVIGMPTDEIEKQIRKQTKDLPSNPVTLRRDVGYDLVYYLRENQDKYPGVTVQRVYVRNYPDGNLGAQIYGYVREVTGPQLKEARYQGLQPGDQVGQSGIENTYDNILRGTNGTTRVQVDAAGNPTGRVLNQVQPKPGDNLVLSLDRPVQEAGEQALSSFSTPGAFVAMNARNGEILGLGSSPTFDPAVFSKPVIPTSVYKSLTSETTSSPLTNRAIQGLYPTGSTFKPITAIAALESGVLTPSTTIVDGGSFSLGDGVTLHNAGNAQYGALQLSHALQVSSDVFFYNVGADLYTSHNTNAQDKWASDLGIGHPTGIDLPGEVSGLLPTPEWRDQLYKEAQSPDSPGGKQILPEQGETDRPWTMGDNVNLAVGQGDLQANPLQMAVAYSAIGNGGDVVRPHVGMQVEDPNGSVVQDIDPAPIRHLDINPSYRSAIMEGLHAAAQEPTGTSYDVFGSYPIPMAGKTGTAQRLGYADQSWYVCLAPYPNPKIVVAATIEEGGFGVESAAPTAQQILTAYYDEHPQEAKKAGGKPPKATPISAGAVVSSPN